MTHISNLKNHTAADSRATALHTRAAQLHETQQRMGELFTPNQILGRLQTIGCVAVEITQKCNLDCTLCYLSEHSQQVVDIPIEEVFKRLDDVIEHYGKGTHVQITGGDPTLRKHSELIKIVKYANDIGLYTALFTNGIGATRKLLTRLAEAGLRDIAFHVDTTQRRKIEGKEVETEARLNDIRQEYLDRSKGLGLMVIFNTTVHIGNFSEVPKLVEFFRERADKIGLVSFQLQADTGRGEWRERDVVINKQSVCAQIEKGSTDNLPWDVIKVGHSDCHFYLPTVVANNTIYPIVDDKQFFADFLDYFQHISWDRQQAKTKIVTQFLTALLKRPSWVPALLGKAFSLVKAMFSDLVKSRGQAHQLTFFVQNFMDAEELVQERIDGCSFMVMTDQGPVSMCQHNSQRDDYILRPFEIKRADGSTLQYKPLPVKLAVNN